MPRYVGGDEPVRDEPVDEVDRSRGAPDAPDRLPMIVLRDLVADLMDGLRNLVRIESQAADERRRQGLSEQLAVAFGEDARQAAARVDLPPGRRILGEASK